MCKTTSVYIDNTCSYCGYIHFGFCPRIEEIEYYPNGTIKRVRLREGKLFGVVYQPDAISKTGLMYGNN